MIRPLGPQTVGQRGTALEVTHTHPCERGQLMDDHVRPRPAHRLRDPFGIERVRDHRHSAELVEHRLLRLATRHAMNLMPRGNQTWHQLLSNRPRRSCDKHSHRINSFIEEYLHPTRQDGSPGCDTSEHPGTGTRARGWQCWGPAGNACTTNVAHSAS